MCGPLPATKAVPLSDSSAAAAGPLIRVYFGYQYSFTVLDI